MEGIIHEADSLAGHLKLGRLIVLFDDNGISIDGPTSITVSEDTTARFEAYGWQVLACDGHDGDAVSAAISEAKGDDRPTLIRCKTVIGWCTDEKGHIWHPWRALGGDEIAGTREALGWSHAPFEVPADILAAWRALGTAGGDAFAAWQTRLAASAHKAQLEALESGDVSQAVAEGIAAYKAKLAAGEPQAPATRVASQKAIEALLPYVPAMFGGSADLTGSTTRRSVSTRFSALIIMLAPMCIMACVYMAWQQR